MNGLRIQRAIERTVVIGLHFLVVAVCLAFAQPALAQSTSTFSTTTTGTVDGLTDCANPLIRTINVTASVQISDVNIGILVTHTWRGDLQFILESPNGTRVQLTNGDTGNLSGDNFNVLLDDSAAQLVNSDGNTTNHSTTAPPYQNTFRPQNLLSAFNGENSAGLWQLETCDLFPAEDDGTFQRADLTITSTPTDFADLSLTKSLIGSPPVQGGTAVWRLTVTSAANSTVTADNVVVDDTLPVGFTFDTATGDGSFNSGNGEWAVGSLDPGESATLTITGTVTAAAGTTLTNIAEVVASSAVDVDSTPNNGATGEDDYATSSFTVQTGRSPGVPPVLSCPVGQSVFDWDSISGWTNGTTNNTYAFASFGNINFSLTNDGTYVNNAIWGGATPNVGNYFNGGITPAENVLQIVSNQSNQAGEVVLTMTLPRSFTGLQFSVFDVDFGNNQFADQLIVTGSNGGSAVIPTLTNGNVNVVSGNSVIGDGSAGNDEATGNVVVTFTQAVDTIVVRYGNASTAPADPGQQGIGVQDIVVCNPFAELTVSKVSSLIADPVNGATNPKAIPGATVEYLITVTNIGTDAVFADTVNVLDSGPADAKMCLISRSGGPVIFGDPSSNSGLTYTFSNLGSTGDDVEFSNDGGSSFAYTPVDDGTGCDANITDFRVNPSGSFAGSGNFTIIVRYEIE
ncbi:MAG: proprotein convertase P-domain-containing protein [Pseudomonadota bacterium]